MRFRINVVFIKILPIPEQDRSHELFYSKNYEEQKRQIK
jgi:hypothetical protein